MTKDEALKMALEALKKFHYAMIDAGVLDRQEVLNEGFTAATAIKEALALPKQDGECKHCVNGCPACDARRQLNVLP